MDGHQVTFIDTKIGDVVGTGVETDRHTFKPSVHVFGHFPGNGLIVCLEAESEVPWFEPTEEVL